MRNTLSMAEALMDPEAYPHRPKRVESEETHISWVFLTGEFAYKVKKPVNFGFLDFSTLEKRRFYCQQEVELNRRLAPEIYVGVVAIVERGDSLAVEAEGEAVEYAVKMRQLPRERIMSRLLKEERISKDDIARLAGIIADFHNSARSDEETSREGGMSALRQNITENFLQTKKYIGLTISRDSFEAIKTYALRALEEKAELLTRRIAQGSIRDCHGDLHSGQIFLANEIYILDCIEFNYRFRYSDVVSDIAFLAMDLDNFGREDLSRYLVEQYFASTKDVDGSALQDFYKCYRAYVRGKVISFRLDSPNLGESERRELLFTARRYFRLARSYATGQQQPIMFVTSGLSGTGKSTIAQEVRSRTGASLVSSDAVRKGLAGVPLGEHRYVGFKEDIYSPAFSRRTYDSMLEQATSWLGEGRSVILDASFRKREERERASQVAQACGARFAIIQCTATEEAIRQRLQRRIEGRESASDARWETYLEQKREMEPVREGESSETLTIDNSGELSDTVEQIMAALEGMK